MYIDPLHGEAEADRDLDLASYQQLVVHPMWAGLVAQLTNYPAEVARAIAEHRESAWTSPAIPAPWGREDVSTGAFAGGDRGHAQCVAQPV